MINIIIHQIRYDAKCYFNVRAEADMSQLIAKFHYTGPTGPDRTRADPNGPERTGTDFVGDPHGPTEFLGDPGPVGPV